MSTGTDMANSIDAQAPNWLRRYVRRLRLRSAEGAIAFALVFAVGLVFLGFGAPVYEAEAVLGVPTGVTLVRGSTVPVIGEVRVVSPADFPLGYPLFQDSLMGLPSADGRRLRVLCRGDDAPGALRACEQLAHGAAAVNPRFEVLTSAKSLPRPRSPLTWPGVLELLLEALATGVVLTVLLALAPVGGGGPRPSLGPPPAAEPPTPERSSSPRPPSGPPVEVFSVGPNERWRPHASARPVTPAAAEAPSVVVQSAAPPAAAVAAEARPVGTIVVESSEPAASRSPRPSRRPSVQVHEPSGGPSLRPPMGFESIPAPPIPEGPLVKALALRDYVPHERVVRPAADERFRALVSRLTWNADEQSSLVGVAGAGNSGPKAALLAARIAWAVAETGKARVLLLDADVDDPQLHRVLRLDAPAQAGFSQQLQARLGRGHAEPWQVQRVDTMLDVLIESRFRAHRAAQVGAFAPAFDVFRLHYDVVIAVLPTLVPGSRAGELAYLCDGLVAAAPRGVDGRALRERAVALVGEERFYALVEDTDLGERVTLPPSR